MKISRLLLVCIASLILSGCAGTPFTWDDAKRIQPGMTSEEVTAIMGPPFMMSVTGNRTIYTWSYAEAFTGSRAVSVVFINNKVAEAPPVASFVK